jgi:hypothetical protein
MIFLAAHSGSHQALSVTPISRKRVQGEIMKVKTRTLVVYILLLALCSCLGPEVPVRVHTETKDMSGTKRDLDFSFLKAGATTRTDVSAKLAPINTGVNEPMFFWGRWENSSWASTPIVAPYAGSREWGTQNILISFDRSNLVQSWRVVKDKELLQELTRLQALVPPLDLSSPLRLQAKLRYWEPVSAAHVTLATDYFEFAASQGFKTDRSNLKTMTLTSEVLPSTDPFDKEARPQPDPTHIWVKLKFAKSTAKGKAITLGLDPPSVLLLSRYLAQTKKAPTHSVSLCSFSAGQAQRFIPLVQLTLSD